MQGQARICQRCYDDHEGDDCVGYARGQGVIAGRKAAEKDFDELLELANRMVAPAGPKFLAVTDFKSWKKARGLR